MNNQSTQDSVPLPAAHQPLCTNHSLHPGLRLVPFSQRPRSSAGEITCHIWCEITQRPHSPLARSCDPHCAGPPHRWPCDASPALRPGQRQVHAEAWKMPFLRPPAWKRLSSVWNTAPACVGTAPVQPHLKSALQRLHPSIGLDVPPSGVQAQPLGACPALLTSSGGQGLLPEMPSHPPSAASAAVPAPRRDLGGGLRRRE